ncbi:MAG: ATP-binding cassette domain-containing protein, partial [Thermoleophilia bacterium]
MPGDALIRLEGVNKDYRMGEVTVHALQGLDLQIGAGEFVVLLGPSGCGKTTTLNLIGGLDAPDEGRIFVHGEEISAMDEKALTLYRRRQDASMVVKRAIRWLPGDEISFWPSGASGISLSHAASSLLECG